jgi:hypothetical protein
VSWLYRVNNGKSGPLLGALRQVAASRAGHGVYCAMNDLGYAHTFEAAVRSLIATLKRKDDDEVPYYSEVSLAAVGSARIGFNIVELWRDKDGDTKCMDTTTLLLTRSPETLQAQDATDIQFITPGGEMINAKRVASSDGEIEMNLDLARTDDSNWSVKGKFRGKDVNEAIDGGSPSTFTSETALLRTLLAKKDPIGAEATVVNWAPTDPAHFSKSTVKVLAALDAGAYRVQRSGGDLTAELTVDGATGQITRVTFQVGPGNITAERVFVRGKL